MNELDSDDEFDQLSKPERIIESKNFRDTCAETYQSKVQGHLIDKKWFKKVDALEMFTNYWSYGRGLHAMPKHNIYVPVT